MTVLAAAADLLAAGGRVVLLDVRWALGDDQGREKYLAGHLPGAVFVDLETELADPPSAASGRHPLPSLQRLQSAARRWGIRDGDAVVAYDATGGLAAARGWWLLRWGGLPDVRLLDGGLDAWRRAGGPVEPGDVVPEPGDVMLTGGGMPVLTIDEAASLPASGGVLLDARAGERYRGEVEPIDPRAGHVPGATSAPTTENLAADGTFRPPGELAERFDTLGVRPGGDVAVYCGSGVTAAHEVAALAAAGIEAALWPGSWSQWSADPARPVATAPKPG
ncbi:MAG: putative thiosulfate sulfurtransferase sseB [Blastococcus sp.]|nr:putative thiosulfate sulfurtransferase sseB [Blastococcus sp.]